MIQLQTEINKILDVEINRTKIRDIRAKIFCRYCLDKLSGISAYDYEIQNLTETLNSWRQKTMSDDFKLSVIERLMLLGLWREGEKKEINKQENDII